MKLFIVLALVALAKADVKSADFAAEVLKSSYDISPEGQFQYAFETSNGIASQAAGQVKNQNSDNPELEVSGSAAYTAPDGTPVRLTYIANENGFQPQGDHLPVPPPVPEAIQRSLAYIAAHPPLPEPVKNYASAPQPQRFG